MVWYLLFGLMFIVCLGIIIAAIISQDVEILGYLLVVLLVSVIPGALVVGKIAEYNSEINTFVKTKNYIECVTPTLPEIDNATITLKKIEMNNWLYEIQYRKERYGFWNVIPDKVMKLEEIK